MSTEIHNPAMNPKQRVAEHAASFIENGMIVGLGTGSTANCFIDVLALRQQQGLEIQTTASSAISAIRARQAGLTVLAIEQLTHLDVYVDGADEVTDDLQLLKGRGQDLVAEKLLASHANSFFVLVDESKMVTQIGQQYAIPIEVLPSAWQLVMQSLQQHGASGELRRNSAGDNVAVTAAGNLVLDMRFADIDTAGLNQLLDTHPGIVEHGVFYDLASAVFIADSSGVRENWR